MKYRGQKILSLFLALLMLLQAAPFVALAEDVGEAPAVTYHQVRFLDVAGEAVGPSLYVVHGGSVADKAPEAPEVAGSVFVAWECSEGSTLEQVMGDATFFATYAPEENPAAAFTRQVPEKLPEGYQQSALEDGTLLFAYGEEAAPLYAVFGAPEGEAEALGFYAAEAEGAVQFPFVLVHEPVYPFTYIVLKPAQIPEGMIPIQVVVEEEAGEEGALSSLLRMLVKSAQAEQTRQIFAYGDTYVTAGTYRGVSGFYYCDGQGQVAEAPVFALTIPTPTQKPNTIAGVEDTTAMPGLVFDAMFGVSACDGDFAPLDVAISGITCSAPGFVFTPGDTSFEASLTEQVVYTVRYSAFAPDDAAKTPLLTAQRKVTVFDSSREYFPGLLEIEFDKLDATATTYSLSDGTTHDSIFTVRYTTAPNKSTNKTVLVVKKLAYGTDWGAALASDSNILEVQYLDKDTCAILFKDGVSGSFKIDFSMKRIPLDQATCEQWMDNGSMPLTNLTAQEYFMPLGVLGGIGSDITTTLQLEHNYFPGGIALANPGTDLTMSAEPLAGADSQYQSLHTYAVYTFNEPSMQDYTLSSGWGRDGGNNTYYYGKIPTLRDPNLMYMIPTIHYENLPLIEVKGIKLYTPDPRLELAGVSNTPSSARQSNVVADADYYKTGIWSNWKISGAQSDEGGIYYLITPPSGKRIFNNSDAANLNKSLAYGMRLLWKLKDIGDPLTGGAEQTTYQNAAKSSLLYQVPSGNETPREKVFQHESPKVVLLAMQPAVVTQAYGDARHKDNGSNQNVILGSTQASKPLTYLTNSWGLDGVVEKLPTTDGACTQHYEFPFEIRPTSMTFSELNQRPPKGQLLSVTDGCQTELASIVYYTGLDNTPHSIPQSQVDAVNAYYSGDITTPGTVEFSEATPENPVTKIDVKWNKVLTTAGLSYPIGLSGPYANSPMLVKGGYATVVTNMAYEVGTKHADDSGIVNYDKAQALYSVDFADPSTRSFTPEAPDFNAGNKNKLLWWVFKVPYCPTVVTEQHQGNASNILSLVADGVTELPVGNMYLDIGQLGEKINILENPVIDFFVKYNGSYILAGQSQPTLLGMSEREALSFLTGEFVAMPALSGWEFVYTTNKSQGIYTVGEIQGETTLKLPLGAGEYFTSLSLRYPGHFDSGHLSDGGPWVSNDTDTKIPLLKNIKMRYLKENPFTGEALKVSWDFYSVAIQLHGYCHWDQCYEDGNPHIKTAAHPGAKVSYSVSNPYEYPPILLMNTERQLTLQTSTSTYGTMVTAPAETIQVYQGLKTNGTLSFNVNTDTNRFIPDNHTHTGHIGQGYVFSYPQTAFSKTSYYAPWGLMNEAVFVELLDPAFVVDLDKCSLYGIEYSSGNLIAETVEVQGRTFLKLQVAPGVVRTTTGAKSNALKVQAAEGMTFINVYNNAGTANLAGNLSLGFQTMPGTPTGFHYPVGDVYLDFSGILDMYRAPGPSADGITCYNIAGNSSDPLGLSKSKSTLPNKLFQYNFSETSSTPFRFQVLEESVLGATLIPGKKNILFDFATLITRFMPDQREQLDGLISVQAGAISGIFDTHVYMNIPRKGVPVTYMDEQKVWRTATPDYSLFLKGEPTLLTDSTGIAKNLTYSYTNDPSPSASSDYSYNPGKSGWEAVTGLCLTVREMPMKTAVNVRLNLKADEKESFGELNAYSSGPYTYRVGSAKADANTAQLPLATWTYDDYVLVQPDATVFWDVYDENGQKNANNTYEPYVKYADNVAIALYDTDGTTLIDRCVVGDPKVFFNGKALTDGQFYLRTHKLDEGQVLRVELPNSVQVTATQNAVPKLARQSTKTYSFEKTDSDFDRKSLEMVLPALAPSGLKNLSAGLVRLPDFTIADQKFDLGATPKGYGVSSFVEFFGAALPAAPTYRLHYDAPEDTSIIHFAPFMDGSNQTPNKLVVTSAMMNVLKMGKTTAQVRIENTLGDKVVKTYNLEVVNPQISVKVTKSWTDASNAKGARPASLTVELLRSPMKDGTPGTESARTVAFSGASNAASWTYTFTGLDKYNDLGEAYAYTVQEADVPHYALTAQGGTMAAGFTMTNTYRPDPVVYAVSVTKAVNGNTPQSSKSKDFTFTLTGNGSAPVPVGANAQKVTTLTAKEGETLSFGDMIFTAEGTFTYTLKESAKPATGYNGYTFDGGSRTITVVVADDQKDGALRIKSVTNSGGSTTFTNTYVPTKTSFAISATKEIQGMPVLEGDFTFDLAAVNGAPMPAKAADATRTRKGPGTVSFGAIDYTVAGAYQYTITERTPTTAVPGYSYNTTPITVTVNVVDNEGLLSASVDPVATPPVITNTFTMPTLDVKVTKEWVGDDALLRPEAVTVQLSRTPAKDGTPGSEAARTMSFGDDDAATPNTWAYVFTDLDQYNDKGEAYTYSVKELNVHPNYLEAYAGTMVDGFVITNTFQPMAFQGEKVWDIQGGMEKPDHVTVALYQNGTRIGSVDVLETSATDVDKNRWAYQFDNLPEYDKEGLAYRYTVAEEGLPEEFMATVSGGVITNLNPQTVKITVRKEWDHTGAPAEDQPSSVKVQLKRTKDGKTFNVGKAVTLEAKNGWSHTFEVQEAHTRGYTFTVEETPAENYVASYGEATDGALVITNTYVMPKVTVSGEKTWKRADGVAFDDSLEKPTVTINLWRNNPSPKAGDTPFRVTTIDKTQSGYAFAGLDRYDESGVPYEYTVTETPVNGYIAALATPKIDSHGNVTIHITNTYHPDPVTYAPSVLKNLTGDPAPMEEYAFTLARVDKGSPMPADATGGNKTMTIQGAGSGSFGDITFTAPGVHEYTLKENKGKTKGMSYDASTLLLTVTVSDEQGSLRVAAKVSKNGSPAVSAFTNHFMTPTGSLRIGKTVSGTAGNETREFEFLVNLDGSGSYRYTGAKNGSLKNGDVIRLKHQESIVIEGITEGTQYTVTEQNYAPYVPTSSGATGTIAAEQESVAAFTNHLDQTDYTLTIRYWYEKVNGAIAAGTYHRTLPEGSAYRVNSPIFKGWEANKPLVWGTLTTNTVVDVVYQRSAYKLTIRYWQNSLDGDQAAPSFEKTYDKGSAYTVQSPVIMGWSPDKAIVSGALELDTVVDVIYTPNPYTLTVRYWYRSVGGVVAAPTFQRTYAQDAAYNVQSPGVPGWKPDQEKVSGIIRGSLTVDVVYTLQTYTLTVHYIYSDGRQAAPSMQQTGLSMGDEYSVTSPNITGYVASNKLIAGAMPACNVERTVVYVRSGRSKLTDLLEDETPLGLGLVVTNVGECAE